VSDLLKNPRELDDLVQRVIGGGDSTAFDDIVLATERSGRHFLAYRSRSLEMVDELVQRTYVIAYEKIKTYQGDGLLIAWLKGIAHNQLRMELRERIQFYTQNGDELEQLIHRIQEQHNDQDDSDDVRVQVVDPKRERLAACLAQLDERHRSLLQRRYSADMSLRELARHFGKTVNAISVILHRLRGTLRRCVESGG
jgi:RNA polymerase sigma-70 factor (ECF subfamily)